jgi:hypothetical protein
MVVYHKAMSDKVITKLMPINCYCKGILWGTFQRLYTITLCVNKHWRTDTWRKQL